MYNKYNLYKEQYHFLHQYITLHICYSIIGTKQRGLRTKYVVKMQTSRRFSQDLNLNAFHVFKISNDCKILSYLQLVHPGHGSGCVFAVMAEQFLLVSH